MILLLITCSLALKLAPNSGPVTGGTIVTIEDEIFIPGNGLGCLFGSNSVSGVFFNSSLIQCTSPSIVNLTGSINFTVTGVEVHDGEVFHYYPELFVLDISPLNGSDLVYHDIVIKPEQSYSFDDWQIKIHEYSVKCRELVCTLPPLSVLKVLNDTDNDNFDIMLSRNSQQFEQSGFSFQYFRSQLGLINFFTAEPNHGQRDGNTLIKIEFSGDVDILFPKCKFDDNITEGFNSTKSSFLCYSSPGFGKVKLTISVNGIDFSQQGREYFYENITILSYYPDQGTINGQTSVVINGVFMPYSQIYCKFGDSITIGSLFIYQYLTCQSPAQPAGTVDLQVSYNNQDYYKIGPYFYRPKEEITALFPVSGPNSGGTLVNFTLTYLNNTENAYCRIGSIYKTKLMSNLTCMVPAMSIVGSPVKIWISSNDFDYESSITYTYYTQVTLSSISPAFVPDTLMSRTYNISGTNFINSGVIRVSMQGIIYNANFVSTTLLNFTVPDQLYIGRHNVSVAINTQNFSPSQVFLEVYKEPILISINPAFGFLKGGIKLNIRGTDFVYSETIFCRFDTVDVQGTWFNESQLTCINPTSTTSKTSQVSVSFNNKFNFSNSLGFDYISTPVLPSLTFSKSFNQEKVVQILKYSTPRPPLMVKTGQVWVKISSFDGGYQFIMPPHPSSAITLNFTYNYLEFQTGQTFTYTSECVAGKYCPIQSSYIQYNCPEGYSCPGTSTRFPVPCGPGYFSPSSASACVACPIGYYCPLITLNTPLLCPQGYLCNATTLAYEAVICPKGYYCNSNLRGNCPLGFWCGLRTVFKSPTLIGDFRYPQPCMNGSYCAEISIDAYGVDCTFGYYCVAGVRYECNTGNSCPVGAVAPVLCLPGFYSGTKKLGECTPCETGFMCPGEGNTASTVCPAGYVCSISGRPSPYDVCPGGSYCLEGVSTNKPESEVSKATPVLCAAGSYCLMGVISGQIVDGNVKYAQTCIQGTFCKIGTDSPEAEPCTEGHYCPPGSSEPNQTTAGYYSQGKGNALPQPCPAGNYSNTDGATICEPCPAGYYCPYDQMTTPIICEAGKYRELISASIYCELCPEGTYSVTPGLSSIDQCIPCDASIICLSRGLNSLNKTAICPEGYVCDAGTTSSLLEKSPCPGGFWCATKTSKLADYGICDPGFYCPKATGISSRHQFVCLEGFYCPPATYAELNSKGQYEFINSSNYKVILKAKEDYNKNCTGSCVPKEIPVFDMCEEDKRLSDILKDNYTSLKCPKGTNSNGGAVCVGQCLPDGELTTLVNPDVGSRRLADVNMSIELQPMSMAILTFDFSFVDVNFYYNTDFSLQVWGPNNESLQLPDYFSSDGFFHHKFNLTLINIGAEDYSITPTIYLHNDLFIPYIPQLEGTLQSFVLKPSRAVFAQDVLFASLLWEGSFGNIDMPFNLLDLTKSDGSPIDPWILDTGVNEEWNGTQYDSPPYDKTFWINYGVSSVAIPWLPFFMNCEYFGDRIYIHRLTEAMGNCTFVDSNGVKIVQPLPVSGVSAVADKCSISVKCFYGENVQPTSSTRWFEINQQEVLYYLTRYAISPSDFDATMSAQDSGFTQHIKDQDDYVVLVKFSPASGGSGVPTLVTMDLSYYQKDAKTKVLVSAEVTLNAYSPAEAQSANPGYTLVINYQALGWFDLLNKFQFEMAVYFLLFIFISVILLIFGYTIYKLHLCCARDPPVLHFRFYLWVSSLPPTIGVVCASLPVILVAYALDPLTTAFSSISGDWAVEPPLDPDTITMFQRGRVGMCMSFCAFCFFVYGSRLLIPKPDPPEEEEEGEEGEGGEEGGEEGVGGEDNEKPNEQSKNISKQELSSKPNPDENQDENTDARFEDSEPSNQNDESNNSNSLSEESPAPESEPEEEPAELPLWDGLKMKRRYFMVACLGVSVFASIKLEISYSKMFADNIFIFQASFCMVDIFIYQLFSRIVLDEALLIVPILASLFVNRAILMLASPNFTIFMQCYVINFGFIIFERIYLNPFIELVEQKLQFCTALLVTRFRIFNYFFGESLKQQLLLEKSLMSGNMKGKFETGETNNRMMGTMVQMSAQSQVTFMLPLVYLFISIFGEATQIPKNYGIRKTDVNYYLLFTITIIIPQLIIDVFMLHLIESLYGYKLFDYLTYCSHRFSTRATWWRYILGLKLDKSLLPVWRSIDSQCFSSQFYFSVTLASWGIVLLTLGFTIMIRNSFNPCGDPLIFVYLFLTRYLSFCLKRFYLFIRPYVRLWVPNSHPIFQEELPENDSDDHIVDLIESYAEENELIEQMKSDLYRVQFTKLNVPFIVDNLADIVENNQQCHNYLKSRYKQLFDKHLVDEKDRNYVEHRLGLLKLLPNNKFNPDFEVSFDRDLQVIPKCEKKNEPGEKIMRKWLSGAKLNIELKKAVEDETVLKNSCEVCNVSQYLKIITKRSFDEIYAEFKEIYKGYPLKLNHWKTFYFRNQVIRTVCVDCAYLEQLKLKGDPKAFSDLTKVAYEELKLFKEFDPVVSQKSADIARMWLEKARFSLGNDDDQSGLFTIQSVSEQDLSAVVSELQEPQDSFDQ